MNRWYRIGNKAIGHESQQLTRYLLTGGLAWVVDVSVFAICVDSFGVISAQITARALGAVVAFLGHKFVAFRQFDYQPATVASEIVGYAALWILSFCISTLALLALIEFSSLDPIAAKIIVETGIVMFNYLVMRSLIFQNDTAPSLKE